VGSSTSDSPAKADWTPGSLLGVPRVVILLGVVSLLNDLAGEMVTPLLPLFLVGPLMAPVAVVGLVEGTADSVTALLKVWVGHRSDTMRRRKPYIVLGYGLTAMAKPLLAISALWQEAFGARVLDRAGKGVRGAPRDAAIADAAPKEILGRAFGVHRAFDTAGAVGGSIFALVLVLAFAGTGAVSLSSFQLIFLVASVPGGVSIALLILGLREDKPKGDGKEGSARSRKGLVQALRELPPPVRRFIGISGLFAIGNFTLGLFILRVNEFSSGIAAGLVAYIAFNIVATAVSIPAGILADKHGRRALVAAGFVLFAVACVAFAFVSSFEMAFAAFLVYGVYFAVWEASYRAYMGEICPKESRATALGAQGTVLGILTLPGSALAGVVWSAFGAQWAFMLGAGIAVAALVAFLSMRGPGQVSTAA
jgi:MFS family permease